MIPEYSDSNSKGKEDGHDDDEDDSDKKRIDWLLLCKTKREEALFLKKGSPL